MEKVATIIVKLPEIFGARAARKLERELKSRLAQANPSVILDLSRVRRIDSKGVAALLHCMEELAKHDNALQFAGISPEAATVLELTRMDRLFQKFPSFAAENATLTLVTETETDAVSETEGTVIQPVAA